MPISKKYMQNKSNVACLKHCNIEEDEKREIENF